MRPHTGIRIPQRSRRAVRRARRALALGVAIAGPLSAQAGTAGSVRERVFGLVRTASGEPWSSASVHLVSRPWPGDERIGELDRITVESDARGRFRADILAGRPYSVWASQATRDDGTYRLSGVFEDAFPRVPVLLSEQPGARERRAVRVHGLDAWRGLGPWRCFARSDTDNMLFEQLEMGADGAVTLPAWPGREVRLEVLGADGRRVLDATVRLDGEAAHGSVALVVPVPVSGRIAVRDIQTEDGIGSAQLFAYDQGRARMFAVGATDADGYAELPMTADQKRAGLLVFAEDHAPAPVQTGPEVRRNGNWPPLREGAAPDLHARLGVGSAVRGTILLGPGRPAARLTLLVDAPAVHYVEQRGRSVRFFSQLVHTDDAGRFVIRGAHSDFPTRIHAVLTERLVAGLPTAWRAGPCPLVFDLTDVRPKDDQDLGELSLSELCPVELHVRRADGVPADRADVAFFAAVDGALGAVERARSTDRDGRLLLLVAPGREPVLAIRHATQTRLARLRVERAVGRWEPAQLTVTLRMPLQVGGTVLDQRGRPAARVRVRCLPARTSRRRRGDDAPLLAGQSGRNRAAIVEVEDPRTVHLWFRNVLRNSHAKTDDHGRFAIDVPPLPMTYRVYAESAAVSVSVEDESVLDVELEVER